VPSRDKRERYSVLALRRRGGIIFVYWISPHKRRNVHSIRRKGTAPRGLIYSEKEKGKIGKGLISANSETPLTSGITLWVGKKWNSRGFATSPYEREKEPAA